MGTASVLATQRIEWMWKSNPNPWSHEEPEEWRSYSDVEAAIIEEAYMKKEKEAVLDGYCIDFQRSVQISKINSQSQRPVRRTTKQSESITLRAERFMTNPLEIEPFIGNEPYQMCFIYATNTHIGLYRSRHPNTNTDTRKELVEKAAEGLIVESRKLEKEKEGEWMARPLLGIKEDTCEEVWKCCIRLYCMESFLYKRLKEVMCPTNAEKQNQLLRDELPSLSPFAWILHYLECCPVRNNTLTLYRGANLSDELIDICQKNCTSAHSPKDRFCFPAFTSTTQNRTKAGHSGNVLFIITTPPYYGTDVSSYSAYDEEEYLFLGTAYFHIRSCEFDKHRRKWIIHLE